MYMTYDEVKEMNTIQLEIFKEFVKICKELGLKYYMIHGSLLGSLRYKGFFPFDDDIDVAMPRKDYEILLKKGQQLLPEHIFIQSCISDKEYPLAFAKIRNSNTAFIQPVLNKLDVNMGIYIDVFPLDYFPQNKWKQIYLRFMEYLLGARISVRMSVEKKEPSWKTALRLLSVIFCPSWKKAVIKRAELYSHIPKSSKVITVSGKGTERGIPVKWFSNGRTLKFEGIDVRCPSELEEYLSCIYGDYLNYNPAEKYMNENNCVNVSANIVSTTKSYKSYIRG